MMRFTQFLFYAIIGIIVLGFICLVVITTVIFSQDWIKYLKSDPHPLKTAWIKCTQVCNLVPLFTTLFVLMDAYRRLWKVGTISQYKMILHFCSFLLVLFSTTAACFWSGPILKKYPKWFKIQLYMIFIDYALSFIPLMTIMNSIMDQSKEMSSAAQGEQDNTMYYNLTQSEIEDISISQHSLNAPNDE